MWKTDHIVPFWDDEYKHLDYTREPFNHPKSEKFWRKNGYTHEHFTGLMADMRKPQPSWNNQIIEHFPYWNDVATSYYRMDTGVILPSHIDLYKKYKELFGVNSSSIWRAIVFLEDKKSGHIFEISGEVLNWKAGDVVLWNNDVQHLAANIGISPRYTLQVTGWLN